MMDSTDLIHKQLENELALYKKMINASLDSITLIDRNYTYRIVTDAFTKARRLSKDEILNHTVAEVWGEVIFTDIIKDKLDACFCGETISHVAAYEFNKDEINYIETIYTPCFTSGAQASHAVVISHNITELKKSEARIESLAYYDPLTGLPSRPLFFDLLRREIIKAQRSKNAIAVFFFDLDEFKKTNDSFGHSGGDELLAGVGKRLRECLRKSDIIGRADEIITMDDEDKPDYLARIGGDEFTLILPEIKDKGAAGIIAKRILSQFEEPFRIGDKEIFISTSIGIAMYPSDGEDVETLLKNADSAMYKAKEGGKNTFRYYSAEMNLKARERINIETRLRYAIKNQNFQLHYQPQYHLEDSRLTGMEALIRWKDEEMGLIPPMEFIPMAEESGMIIEIGNWAIFNACRQAKKWHDQGYADLTLGVNLSVRQFFDPQLPDKIKAAINTTAFDPTKLELEITETAMMHDTDRAVGIVNELKAMGIRISLDDFGTGFSSLVHLKLFPVDSLKIDQMFVRNADLEGRDGEIISAIIQLCHKLGIKVIAEGVETLEGLNFLKRKHCHSAQGYFFSPPLPIEKFEDLLRYQQN